MTHIEAFLTVKVAERGSSEWAACRAAYLARFSGAEPMSEVGDFKFVAVKVTGAWQVAGLDAARSIDGNEIRLVLGSSKQPSEGWKLKKKDRLEDLPNIGKSIAADLRGSGILSPEQLSRQTH